MAEYIDRNKLNKKKKYLFQTQGMPFPKSEYFIKVDDFWSMPVADVVERSKIDKAIEEIKKLPDDYCDNAVSAAIFDALGILEENIGE